MSQNSEIEPGYCPATYLDPKRIGEILLRVIPASAAAGHAFPVGTLRDYCRPTDSEMEFVIDMFSKPTPEIAERWYDGVDYASRIACQGREWPGM